VAILGAVKGKAFSDRQPTTVHERQLPTIAQLRAFVSIATQGSFGKAATALHTSQSALSYQIDQLEEHLGILLVHRTRRGVTLTEAGQGILEKAHAVLAGLGEITSKAQSYAKGVAGHVTIGVHSALQMLGPKVATRFKELYPQVRLSIREANAHVIREWLVEERIDIGILWDVGDDDRMACIALHEVDGCLIGAISAYPRPEGEISVRNLADVPLVLPTPANSWRRRMDKVFEDNDVLPVAAFNSDSIYTTKELVRAGAACALLPQFVVRTEIAAGTFWATKVRELCAGETIRLIKLKTRALSPAGIELQKTILEQFAKLDIWDVVP
jgi:LysR family transcriptional regulator, nitrogen assimilation regulatory protein